jgi:hypothetical protein
MLVYRYEDKSGRPSVNDVSPTSNNRLSDITPMS